MNLVNRFALGALSLSLIYGLSFTTVSADEPGVAASRKIRLPQEDRMRNNLLNPSSKAASSQSKLDSNLQRAAARVRSSKGSDAPPAMAMSDAQLQEIFGVMPGDPDPQVEVVIKTDGSLKGDQVTRAGARLIRLEKGNMICARVPIASLNSVASLIGVQSVRGMTVPQIPGTPNASREVKPAPGSKGETDLSFNNQGMTGRGVIVAVIDSGIDWRHQDFINADGTSRILYLYDLFDATNHTSGGKVGQPGFVKNSDGTAMGTIYTNADINAALKGTLQIATEDLVGHGTACAGTAAGNGRATANGVPAKKYSGVAPEADLIVVRAGKGGGISSDYAYVLPWILDKAKGEGKPCVISMSFGGHHSRHDGTSAEEEVLDSILSPDIPGLAACVAAGNEGQERFHAAGTFGPRKPGQQDQVSDNIELLSYGALLDFYFDPKDDWGVLIHGAALVADNGKPFEIVLWRTADKGIDGTIADKDGASVEGTIAGKEPMDFLRSFFMFDSPDHFVTQLPSGLYGISAFAPTPNVSSGRFDIYALNYTGSFARGSEVQYMVGAPGTAKNVITVGSYDFRSSWPNLNGTTTFYNLPLGNVSNYSSPGYSRDGRIKPEITAPATYTISSLARTLNGDYAQMGSRKGAAASVTPDGYHLAWSGTSAATPYCAGVIALMLQKNPQLTGAQIKEILQSTAKKDNQTGSTPNREWGYGKLDPGAALTATPKGSTGLMAN